jgi:hypothetical protein
VTQLTAALLALRRVARVGGRLAEVRSAPGGDPASALALAEAYRAAAEALHLRETPAAFTRAAAALREYAAALAAAQAAHAAPRPITALARGRVQAHTAAARAADLLAIGCADLAGRALLGAGVLAGLPAGEADALASAARRGYDSGVLGPRHLRAAAARLAELGPTARARVADLLDRAGSPVERAWLVKAFAAAPPDLAGVAEFAETVRGRPEPWLAERLTLIDRHGPGPQTRLGAAVRQYEATTCGTTSLIVARAEHDPRYALTLTSGDFAAAFRDARATVHDETNRWYPQFAGTSPRGMAVWLSRHVGVRHRWRLVDDRDPRSVSAALRRTLGAVDDGFAVPLLVGAVVPRHYVLAVGHHDGSVLVFEPTAGRTVAVPDSAFLSGGLRAALGFPHLQAVVVPDGADRAG